MPTSASPYERGGVDRAAILVVEDDEAVAAMVVDELVENGFRVIGVAGTCEQALRLAEESPPAIAIVDIRLAGHKDGIVAAGELRRRYGTRILFASGAADPITRKRAEMIGPAAFLWKPFVGSQLLAAVEKASE